MTRWEYLRVTYIAGYAGCHSADWKPLADTLNDYGAKGWELVAIVGLMEDGQLLTFKRPLAEGLAAKKGGGE